MRFIVSCVSSSLRSLSGAPGLGAGLGALWVASGVARMGKGTEPSHDDNVGPRGMVKTTRCSSTRGVEIQCQRRPEVRGPNVLFMESAIFPSTKSKVSGLTLRNPRLGPAHDLVFISKPGSKTSEPRLATRSSRPEARARSGTCPKPRSRTSPEPRTGTGTLLRNFVPQSLRNLSRTSLQNVSGTSLQNLSGTSAEPLRNLAPEPPSGTSLRNLWNLAAETLRNLCATSQPRSGTSFQNLAPEQPAPEPAPS